MSLYSLENTVTSSLSKAGQDEQLAYSLSILHAHCESCFKANCSIKSDNLSSCETELCPLGCGHRLHMCKMKDHKEVCPQLKVPCVNQEYGCPIEMLRCKLASHIKVCPASVMRCVIEWNRWPMHCTEDKVKASLPIDDPHVKCAQLDVALALRDQRILMESMKAPKSVRKILQNSITRKYPSVPFVSHSSSVDSDTGSGCASVAVSDDESDAPWESDRLTPGLKTSMYSKLVNATKQTSDSLSATLNIVCSRCSTQHLSGIREAEDDDGDDYGAAKCDTLAKKSLVRKSRDIKPVKLDSTLENDNLKPGTSFQRSDDKEILDISAVTNGPDRSPEVKERDISKIYSQHIKLYELLGVSLNIEVYSKYIPKPTKMFTFLCAQDFRRDEYSWHFKNVHNDIHCGLNGFLEQRCPLAYRGCTFSYQNIVPKVPEGNIVHSSWLASFGLLTSNDQCFEELNDTSSNDIQDLLEDSTENRRKLREATPEIVTSQKYDSTIKVFPRVRKNSAQYASDECPFLRLPWEILQLIGANLDGFSLCNLSLACKKLRDVACSLLTTRGMVLLVWEKVRLDHRSLWKVTKKRWCFSTSFTPVRGWEHRCKGPLLNHLKVCPYNQDEDKSFTPEKWSYTESWEQFNKELEDNNVPCQPGKIVSYQNNMVANLNPQ